MVEKKSFNLGVRKLVKVGNSTAITIPKENFDSNRIKKDKKYEVILKEV